MKYEWLFLLFMGIIMIEFENLPIYAVPIFVVINVNSHC